MAQFLRDVYVSNIKITEDVIIQLAEVFANRAQPLIDNSIQQKNDDLNPYLTFIIRFDGKGYRLFSVEELLRHFKRAKSVERLIITIETPVSLRSNRAVGEHLEARFDKLDEKNCSISVTSDDSDWVDSSYSAVQETISKYKTKNGWARSGWSTLTIQLLGVVLGFALSLWAASEISPSLPSIENSFIIVFIFALLMFSNAWGYINNIVLFKVHNIFPNILFYRPDKDRINWLIQGLIIGVTTAFMLSVFGGLFAFIAKIVNEIPK